MSELRPETRAIHTPIVTPTGSTPLGMPIYQSHLFAFDSADGMAAAFDGPGQPPFYSRLGNPTVRSFELALADLEGGTGALATASGMAAINAVLKGLLRSGDHVVAQTCLYGGTYGTLETLKDKWGVEVTYVSGDDPAEVAAAVRPTTKILYLETIANPTTRIPDFGALFAAVPATVKKVVDNTFATPLLCRPLEFGADIVVHSATKYLCGHGDVLAGVIVTSSPEDERRIWEEVIETGPTLDPFAAFLLLRGLTTLGLRVERHSANAQYLAERLSSHPAVASVSYPGLPTHPDHKLAHHQFTGGAGGVLAFDLKGARPAGQRFIESTRLISLTASLGEAKTLAIHPASTSHRMYSPAALTAAGFTEGTIRLAVGIEHPEDLWTDLQTTLNTL
ncbi:aminotransferase class I/II-fold pyridoxal phosphate-dependent enzyme [Actinocorallia sp. API 0066]|uniref:trans-sulfuration enzyme family protein n=1 Tax=Actinocorallia sp. API 0066 TaxID=2896846 RepID=UPI001E57297D|nr:aminotransferase class I/II-fold pyridoxal phosphate-dependent enzyme [Actinocorallia sp. API 0066]MCD0451457.1 aminotransferase class I/II-fold pyridoxal phosphate-dependent enzyme [Actinocorallia sp. API 0066]